MKRSLLAGAALAALALISGCGGSVAIISAEPDGGDNQDSGVQPDVRTDDGGSPDGNVLPDAPSDATDASKRDAGVPLYHRPDDSQCSQPAAPGDCNAMAGMFMCTMDSQCTQGLNGRCTTGMGGPAFCGCTYDACVHDTDCPTNQLCVCHGSAYTGGDGNTCMPGNCRVDADCGAGGYCSPTHGTSGCGGVSGYYCHTPADTCVNDSDCNGMPGFNACAWSSVDNRWECQQELLCG